MIGIDTNIVVRYLTQDDPQQCQKIDTLLEKQGKVFVSSLVIVETVWVLESCYNIDKPTIISILEDLVLDNVFSIENPGVLKGAISSFQTGDADFSDYLILVSARAHHCDQLMTFDKKLAKHSFCSVP